MIVQTVSEFVPHEDIGNNKFQNKFMAKFFKYWRKKKFNVLKREYKSKLLLQSLAKRMVQNLLKPFETLTLSEFIETMRRLCIYLIHLGNSSYSDLIIANKDLEYDSTQYIMTFEKSDEFCQITGHNLVQNNCKTNGSHSIKMTKTFLITGSYVV